jgi:4-hydroxybenzoate polyprenyltransferase
VIVTGMGPARAAAAADYAIAARGVTHVINLGLCGALSPALSPGSLLRVTETFDGDAFANLTLAPVQESSAARQEPRPPVFIKKVNAGGEGEPPGEPLTIRGCPDRLLTDSASIWPALPSARLVSVRTPVFGGDRRDQLAGRADVVDMEGHAVAQVCRRRGVACHLLKGVSDRADAGGRETLHGNLDAVSAALAAEAVAGLEHLAPPRPSLAARLASFVKVEHTIFSLPLLLAGAWLGAGGRWPGARVLLLVIVAGAGARALGMAMNRILDRRIDLLNPRTAARELPAGRLSSAQAWAVAAAGLAAYLAACAALGPVCLRLSPIPAAVLISYSLLKRVTALCHYGIGVCLALGPLGACVAVTGHTHVGAATVMLALFTFCWISGFDIIYALLDVRADRELGIHSLPAALGETAAQAVAALTHLVAISAAITLWRLVGGGIGATAALAVMLAAFGMAYFQSIPVHVRFFPVSAIAGLAGAAIALLGEP